MIEIPGDLLEGGGQIVRSALALSALTDKQVKITKIRDRRHNPGLRAQHVVAAKALAAISDAETLGLTQGSRELTFRPRRHLAGTFSLDVGTAGSIPLILQALMPAAAYAPGAVEFDLTGGTDVPWSPSIDYLRLVNLPMLEQMGYRGNIQVHRRGHYPKGGGQVTISVNPPRSLKAVRWCDRGELAAIEGISHCVNLPSHVAQRQASSAIGVLKGAGCGEVQVKEEAFASSHDSHVGPGSGITLCARFKNGTLVGADSLGERGKPAEAVGREAATKLLAELKALAPLDKHMGDMIIPYIAVADGRSEVRVSEVTSHILTNIKVAEMLTGVRFHVVGGLHEVGTISVDGMALKS